MKIKMNFGHAIEALKNGQRVAREGWNGKGMWIALMPALSLPRWLWAVAVHDPRQLLTKRPYALYFAIFLASVDGHFAN